jgi:hypothetical protein
MALYKLIKIYQTSLDNVEVTKPKSWCGKYFKEVKISCLKKRIAEVKQEIEDLKKYKPTHK